MTRGLLIVPSTHCHGFNPQGSILPDFCLSSAPISTPSPSPVSVHSIWRDPFQSPIALRITFLSLTKACRAHLTRFTLALTPRPLYVQLWNSLTLSTQVFPFLSFRSQLKVSSHERHFLTVPLGEGALLHSIPLFPSQYLAKVTKTRKIK